MNNEIETSTITTPTISLNSEEQPQGSIALSRRQASDKRKEDFFKELQAARDAELTPFTQTPTIQSPANTPLQNETHQLDDGDAVVAENATTDEDDEPTGKYIPKSRFDKEIAKRKASEEQARADRDKLIELQTKQSMYDDALAQLNKKNEEPQIRSAEIDPVDADAHSYYMREIKALKDQQAQASQAQAEYQVRAQFAHTVDRQAAEFSAKHSDFHDAYNYVLGVEADKAKLMGYSDEEAQVYALEQLQPIAWKAYEKGLNVAEIAYNMAQKYGYESKVPKAPKVVKADTADLAKIEKNMAKSYSAIDEIKGVPIKLSSPDESALDMEVFNRNFAGSRGRGIDPAKFKALLNNVGKQNRY